MQLPNYKAFFLASAIAIISCAVAEAKPWPRHTIDSTFTGADGVKLADANNDGRPDIVTGWEESGVVRLYLHPGPAKVRSPWPAVTVGKVDSPEDAVFADLDGDGALDVVSSCEGTNKTVFIHWAPANSASYLDQGAWKTEPIACGKCHMQWMFCVPMQVDSTNGIDLVAGGKNKGAKVGWFEAPQDPRQLDKWKWRPLRPAGWIMSIIASDMDADGDEDIVLSDRKGERTGCYWLENPGKDRSGDKQWNEHSIGGVGREVLFMALADLDCDGFQDAVAAAKPQDILFFKRMSKTGKSWQTYSIKLPESAGRAKAVQVGDIDLDGKPDIVFTCESALNKSGVMWLSCKGDPTAGNWEAHDISGPDGVKFDIIELIDLDNDGDLDALTCEEAQNLGVIWYENPTIH